MSRPPKDPESERVGDFVRIFRRGETWHATYQWEGRQHRKSLRTNNVKEARRRALRLENEVVENENQSRKGPARPKDIDSVVGDYLALARTNGRRAGTLARYESALAHFRRIADEMGRTDIDQIDVSFVDAYRTSRTEAGRAPKTVSLEVLVIRQLVNFAVRTGVLRNDPLAQLRLPKARAGRQPCWSWEEVERILAAAHEPQRSMFTLLAETGMRFGEMQWLSWEDVDLDNGVLHVRPKEGWQPKSGDARTVPISSRLRAVLAKLPRRARWVFTAAPSTKYPDGDHQVSERRLLASLKRVLARIDMPAAGKLHTFRHAFISSNLATGTPPSTVRAWVGHVSDDIMRLYTHLHDGQSRAAMDAFEQRRPSGSSPKSDREDGS